jgi:mannosyltransferase OCH1-like enzyme
VPETADACTTLTPEIAVALVQLALLAVRRYAVLLGQGGVYLDSDVECLKPIAEWEAAFNNTARIIISIERSNVPEVSNVEVSSMRG